MKFLSYIMIRCIAPKDINIQELSDAIENLVKKILPNTNITLESNQSYWKEPENNSIIYSILNNKKTKISQLLTLFPLTWEYSKGYSYNIEIQQRIDDEDAIWSQLCHPEEVFLMPMINWVHMYTLEKIETPVIN